LLKNLPATLSFR